MLQRLPWRTIEPELSTCCPNLARSMASIAPLLDDDNRALYVIEYDYGDIIVSDGVFDLECWSRHDEFTRLTHSVTYSPIPLSVVLEGSVEVFRPPDIQRAHSVPLAILRAGEIFGVFETLNTLEPKASVPSRWSVSSGARSVHVLAALSDRTLWDNLTSSLDVSLTSIPFEWHRIAVDSWPLLVAIARKEAPKWRTRILVIPKVWLTGSQVEFSVLREFVLRLGWSQSSYSRESSELEAELESMQHRLPWGALKVDNKTHLKQIIAITQGVAPGFKRSRAGETEFGPFQECERFLAELKSSRSRNGRLCLKQYPVILRPGLLESPDDPVFYSASRPSVLVPTVGKTHAWTDDFLRPFVKLLESKHLAPLLDAVGSSAIELRFFGRTDPTRDTSIYYCKRKDLEGYLLPEAAELALPFHVMNDFLLACVIVARR